MLSVPVMASIGLLLGESVPALPNMGWAAMAGVAAGFGSIAMYRGMNRNSAGTTASMSGLVSAALPVAVSAALNTRPAAMQYLGFAIALIALWFLGGGTLTRIRVRDIRLGMLAGLGYGLFFIIMPFAASDGVFIPNAIGNLAACAVLALAARRRGVAVLLPRAVLPTALAIAMLNSMGDFTYVISAQMTGIGRAAIFASFAPAATMLLARFFWHERLTVPQWAGVTAALVAIPLIMG
jgi:drug/metabolite transporter (DMT)-like permease